MADKLRKVALVMCSLCILACSPFSKVADNTLVEKDTMYISISNPKVEFQSLTFGDFQFARNRKELKKIGGSSKGFRDMLFYAKTTKPTYEYCIMYDPKNLEMNNPEFIYIDTLLHEKRFVLAISKSAPARDAAFIRTNIFQFDETFNPEIR